MSMLQAVELPRRGPAWASVADGLAAASGVVAAVAGVGAVLAIPYGIGLQLTEDRVRVQVRIYQLTSLDEAAYLLAVLGAIAAPGVLGLCLARRRGRVIRRVSLAGAAARLSILGLACDGLLLAALSALLAYRWLIWG